MDPFTPDKGDYSLEDFYTRSTDEKGHSKKINLTVPPGIYAAVARIVECKEFPPLDTYASVARDGLMHRLRWLTDRVNDPPTKKSLHAEMIAEEVQLRMDTHERLRGHIDTMQAFLVWAKDDDARLADALTQAMMMMDYLEGYPDLQGQVEKLIVRYDYRV